jgi:hypothetical protein
MVTLISTAILSGVKKLNLAVNNWRFGGNLDLKLPLIYYLRVNENIWERIEDGVFDDYRGENCA